MLASREQQTHFFELLTLYDLILVQTSTLESLEKHIVTTSLCLELAKGYLTTQRQQEVYCFLETSDQVIPNGLADLFTLTSTIPLLGVFVTDTFNKLPPRLLQVLTTQLTHRFLFAITDEEKDLLETFDPDYRDIKSIKIDPFTMFVRLVLGNELTRFFLLNSMPLEKPDLMQHYLQEYFKQQT